jgi:hypothetical protein
VGIGGRWEGKMLDASGAASRVVLDLDDSSARIVGDFSVYIDSARDGCDSGCGGPKLSHVASVTGRYAERNNLVRLTYQLDGAKATTTVKFSAKLAEADPHASRAFVGTYSVDDETGRIGMEGGACVLWQYAQAKKG